MQVYTEGQEDERVLKHITRFLEQKLKLKVNTEKSAVSSPTKRKFLGYSFYYGKGGIKFRVHDKSYEKLKDKIRKITNRNISMNFDYRIKYKCQVKFPQFCAIKIPYFC